MGERFLSKPIQPTGEAVSAPLNNEPSLPAAFRFEGEVLSVKTLIRVWRSTKDDRGDTYLKRHWFEFETEDGRRIVVYFDRAARRSESRWWIYTMTTA